MPGTRYSIAILESLAKDFRGREFSLLFSIAPRITVGRSPEAFITIPDPYISRLHVAFIHEEGKLFVEDLQSANGTYILDREGGRFARIEPGDRREVKPGDVLKIGVTTIVQVKAYEEGEEEAGEG